MTTSSNFTSLEEQIRSFLLSDERFVGSLDRVLRRSPQIQSRLQPYDGLAGYINSLEAGEYSREDAFSCTALLIEATLQDLVTIKELISVVTAKQDDVIRRVNRQPKQEKFKLKTGREKQLVCIAFQTSYFPGLCKVGSPLMARCNLKEFNRFEGQVGRVTKIKEKGLVHIVFNLIEGPFLRLNTKKLAHSVLSPFLLLHESRLVVVKTDGRLPEPIYRDRFTNYQEKDYQEKQCVSTQP